MIGSSGAIVREIQAGTKDVGFSMLKGGPAKGFDCLGDAFLATDLSGGIICWNQEAERLFGYAAADVLGKSVTILTPRADETAAEEDSERVKRDECWAGHEAIRVRKDGREIEVLWLVSPFRDQAGAVIGKSIVAREITITTPGGAPVSPEANKVHDGTKLNQAQEVVLGPKLGWAEAFDSVPDLIAILDAQHRIVRVNRAMARRFGRSPEQCLGLPCYQCIHGLDQPPAFCPHSLTMQDGQEHVAEVYEPVAGAYFHVSTSPLFNARGDVVGSVHVARDINDRKRLEEELRQANELLEKRVQERTAQLESANAGLQKEIAERRLVEQALRQSEQRFRAIFNATFQFIGLLDPEGKVLEINQTALDFAGISMAEVVNRPFWEGPWWRHSGPLQQWLKTAVSQAAQGKFIRQEVDHVGADESSRVVDFSLKPVFDEGGQVVLLLPEGRDITERKQAEQALRETVSDLESFSYSVSHDLRAPLRSMNVFASMLAQDCQGLGGEAQQYASRISQAAQRMDSLIQDLLAYSRVSQGELALKSVDPAKLLRGMIETYPEFEAARADIYLEGEFPWVSANEAALTQCCSNLLGNAVKFVAAGTKPRVRIHVEPRGQLVRLWFEDNGIGIAKEDQRKIFGIFQRLHSEYEGTGIGLAIVRKAVERMGGGLGLESEPGRGTRFWIELSKA